MKQFFTRHWGSCSPIIILAVAVVWSYFIFFRTFFFGTRVSASLKRTEPLQELKNVRAMMHRCPDVLWRIRRCLSTPSFMVHHNIDQLISQSPDHQSRPMLSS
ncbi:uncharacterized protein LOC126926638 isoform X2 [Bombus affinis]|uniref:uncharacterized protein LOC126926638 isoform X2 n=1 Tax=Bombus affinis TaxID=309941 RepID=UPI0021B73F1D|nr:uncharacterized protein LOC126926638 isoform X2 [Bombus affinis]